MLVMQFQFECAKLYCIHIQKHVRESSLSLCQHFTPNQSQCKSLRPHRMLQPGCFPITRSTATILL